MRAERNFNITAHEEPDEIQRIEEITLSRAIWHHEYRKGRQSFDSRESILL